VLSGTRVRLEPIHRRHVDGLAAAAAVDRSLYQWSPIPQGKVEATSYIDTAIAWREAGSAVPFAIVRMNGRMNDRMNDGGQDGTIIGSTRFFNLERWAWPQGHAQYGRQVPDACEIGYTWLASSAVRTAANTEAKLLMLTFAFETWQVLRVCFHTDIRNQRSRAALERIGGKWPEVKQRLNRLLDQT